MSLNCLFCPTDRFKAKDVRLTTTEHKDGSKLSDLSVMFSTFTWKLNIGIADDDDTPMLSFTANYRKLTLRCVWAKWVTQDYRNTEQGLGVSYPDPDLWLSAEWINRGIAQRKKHDRLSPAHLVDWKDIQTNTAALFVVIGTPLSIKL